MNRWMVLIAAGGLLLPPLHTAKAQSVRSLINGGNDRYEEKDFGGAEGEYRKALEKEGGLAPGHFNLGNALYRQEKYEEAEKSYEAAAALGEETVPARALYNTGNGYIRQGRFADAVKAYAGALRRDPADMDAKYNLSYALQMLRQQQQQQSGQNRRDEQEKKQDQQGGGEDRQQDRNQQEQQEQAEQQQRNQGQDQAAARERPMSKKEAERILEALKNNERDVQKKVRVRAATRAKTEKDW